MEYLIVIAALAVVALVVGGVLLLRPRLGRPRPPAERPADRAGGAAGATAVEDEEAGATTAERAPPTEVPAPRPTVEIEKPPPGAGRMVRLRARLARSQTALGKTLLVLLSRETLDDDAWEEIEDTLITADMGAAVARQIADDLRTRVQVLGTRDAGEVRELLKQELLKQIGPDMDRSLKTETSGDRPAVMMVVGVNGTGKTTTCGKLGRVLVGDGKTVLLGAADTFRAAAADQLETWASRVGAQVVRKDEGADPASVAFDAVKQGIDSKVDVVIVDTAGRLHTKTGLMDELGKVKRVVEKQAAVDEVLLVLDATTGQNGMQQARVFAEVVNVTGVVLTKLDGTAKGGIVVQVQRELGVPVKLVGLGEGPDDLAPFEPEAFVDAIIGES
ncbi:fused signal recognition particle receptor [Actinomadura hallensis]|uniref:Signal recognition particle receptor FtsY n=1 Tax=Actinomadura hallensis TaxID=337895 RepID=A0A543IIX0_9ACTN|nr:signal recognition particle-docking protein FtsY [Actinomadura hallensis]TQM70517.1 fused signal recognition particle receptor [Actinomadura hallensis]HLV75025.1 signal recognition particle-docking protein FtsY [Vulgatibacteraceae bacterium]